MNSRLDAGPKVIADACAQYGRFLLGDAG
jgi:hypothetical protein